MCVFFILSDYIPCNDVEELTMQVTTPSLDQDTYSRTCIDKMIHLGLSPTGVDAFKIKKNGLFVFNIHVCTYGEDNISSLMVNGVEVFQMFSKGKKHYSGSQFNPITNDVIMYSVLNLQTNDEVSFRNISGSFPFGYFIGWSIAS